MHVHRADISLILRSPDQLQEIFPTVDLSGIPHEQLNKVEFLGGKLNLLSVPESHPAFRIDANGTTLQNSALILLIFGSPSPKKCPHTGLQFQDVEGLLLAR